MRNLAIALACAAALAVAAAAMLTPAEARRGGGFHAGGHHMGGARAARANVSRNVNRNVTRNVDRRRDVNIDRNVTRNVTRDVNRRYVYRNGRRGYWRNGVWITVPVAGYVATCAYEYNRWQSTGTTYWRDRYYACAR